MNGLKTGIKKITQEVLQPSKAHQMVVSELITLATISTAWPQIHTYILAISQVLVEKMTGATTKGSHSQTLIVLLSLVQWH